MRSPGFYGGVFLISGATLMLEIIQTRILSVVVWYHLAFFVISVAMLGLTAGAVWVYSRRARFSEKTLSSDLAYFSGLFAVSTALCLAVQMTLAPIVGRLVPTLLIWTELALCLALPFFFSGVVISLALTRSPFSIARVYGIDLLGAATGCLGAVLLLNVTDGPSAVLWSAVVMAVGATLFSLSAIGRTPDARPPLYGWLRRPQWIALGLAILAFVNSSHPQGLQPIAVKGKFEFPRSHVFTQWNSFSRVVVEPVKQGVPFLWGPSPRLYEDNWVTAEADLNIDGDAGTSAYHFTGDFAEVGFLRYDVTNLAYFLPGHEAALVIGVGGGKDVLSAALFGRKEITGVELNPIFVDIITRDPGFTAFSTVARLPGVRFVVDEGRSWVARNEQTFDSIQMSVVDTWAATGAGAYTLSENGLYTVDAWTIFMKRLSPNGVLTVSRWYDPSVPDETGRLVSLAVGTLMEMGAAEPRRHLFLAAQGRIATLVLSKGGFAPAELDSLEKAATDYRHQVLITPRRIPDSAVLSRIVGAADRRALDAYTSSLEFDLTPPTDERPFFFNQLPITRPLKAIQYARGVVGWDPTGGGVRQGNLVATVTLIILFVIVLALVILTIVVPLRSARADAGAGLVNRGTLYFGLIGIGFMLVEIGLLQRMSVYLGSPVYSLSVLLFTLILATGAGSLLSDRLGLASPGRIIAWGTLTSGYLVLLPFALARLFDAFQSADLATRITVCATAIAPAGVLMGFAFPSGMRLVASIDARPTPWFWGINGAAGVLASIVAVAISLAAGISATMLAGALCYVLLIPVAISLTRLEAARPLKTRKVAKS